MNLETFLLPAAAKNNFLVNDLKVFFSDYQALFFLDAFTLSNTYRNELLVISV